MKRTTTGKNPWGGRIALAIVLVTLGIGSAGMILLSGSNLAEAQKPSTDVFTPAHPSMALAFRHFLGIRPEPVQPIAYDHSVHIGKAQMECMDCHPNVASGPRATIPGVASCMSCHSSVATDKPVIQQVAAYYNRGEDIPWQRVYGWNDEAHVRFNHLPHVAATISCAKCHGDVGGMTVAKRVVDHTMGFCVTCHKERKASIDCITCHF